MAGFGVGLLNPVIADVALSVVPKERSGMASGINDTFRQVGVAVGIAAWGAIFLGRGADKVEELAAGTPAATGERPRQLVEAVSSGNLDQALNAVPAQAARGAVTTAAREGFLAGMNSILVVAGVLVAGRRGAVAAAGPRARDRARRLRARGGCAGARSRVAQPTKSSSAELNSSVWVAFSPCGPPSTTTS